MSEIVNLYNDKISVGISTYGAELTYIRDENGIPVLWERDELEWTSSAPVLFPICGRLQNNKYYYDGQWYSMDIHGFAKKSEFQVVKRSNTNIEFVLNASSETKQCYPFDFVFHIIYEIYGTELKISYIVENHSDGILPFSVGSHEGYYCPDGIGEYYVEFYHDDQPVDCTKYVSFANRTSKEILMNGNHLELEDSYFEDDLLVFKNITFNRVVLGCKKDKRKIELTIDNGESFLIWSKSGAHFVCLEPWYGIQRWGCTDEDYDFDIMRKEGIHLLGVGEQFTVAHRISVID